MYQVVIFVFMHLLVFGIDPFSLNAVRVYLTEQLESISLNTVRVYLL